MGALRMIVTGYVVKARVLGPGEKQLVKAISGRFASKSAADDYCSLAKKNGYDSYVTEITQASLDGIVAAKRRRV